MRLVWSIFVACLLLTGSQGSLEDDFDDEEEITVETDEEPQEGVTVEKVTVDVKYFSPDDNVDFYFMDHCDQNHMSLNSIPLQAASHYYP